MNAHTVNAASPEYHAWLQTEPDAGNSQTLRHAGRIKRLVQLTAAETILDYLCGEQLGYNRAVAIPGEITLGTLQDYWDISTVHCYDPRIASLQMRAERPSDGVICTGALSKVPLTDIPWLIDEIFAQALSFVFIALDCTAIRNGSRDVQHAVPGLPEWWRLAVTACAKRHPRIVWELITVSRLPRAPQTTSVQAVFSSLSSSNVV